MTSLPENKHLSIKKLAACFNNTSATYKFYWLLAIIDAVEKEKTVVSKQELFASMVSSAWYTVNYFRISFGAQDNFQRAIQHLVQVEGLTINTDKAVVFERLCNSKNAETEKILHYFDRQVPHWFLSPWFPKSGKAEIYIQSQNFNNTCLYAVHKKFIQVNLAWVNYLLENTAVLKDYCYWNLAMFLQKRNPSDPQ